MKARAHLRTSNFRSSLINFYHERAERRMIAGFGELLIRFERRLDIHLHSFRWPLPSFAHALWMACVSDS